MHKNIHDQTYLLVVYFVMPTFVIILTMTLDLIILLFVLT